MDFETIATHIRSDSAGFVRIECDWVGFGATGCDYAGHPIPSYLRAPSLPGFANFATFCNLCSFQPAQIHPDQP